ncbi:MAG: hypothetical protein M4D80_29405 [Myxococcota bacterium]|nr:hypothetical protein [Myxococcota bacterium]
MLKAALLVTVLAACATEGIGAEHETPTTPLSATTMTSVSGHDVIVATGGALAVRLEDKTSIGLSGSASQGFAVEPYELDRWPNTISPEYWVRANVAGVGSYEIVTSKGIATGLVHSADIARVTLVPAHYELDGKSPFALAANRSELQAQLYDASNRRLVDATLSIAGGTQTAWDTVTLARAGAIHVGGDSLAERTFEVDVVDGAERIESVRIGNRTCFHAYTGATEIVVAMAITGGAPDPAAHNCATASDGNALRVRF